MKQILKAVFVIIGTIIGAGFASGQEMWLFFNKYGNIGIIGLIISCILSGIIIYKVFRIIQKQSISSYTELLNKTSNNKILNQVISIIISLFLLISFYVMIAGMSAYFHQEFNLPAWLCSSIMAILCYITLRKNIKGIMLVNSVLVPCLIIFVMYLGIKNFNFSIEYFKTNISENSFILNFNLNWLFSCIIYASYNSIVLIPIIVELKEYINTKTKAKILSILCTVILILVGICVFCLLLRNESANKFELPMIEVVKEFGKQYQYLYGGVVVAAIFTSAISAGYGFLKNMVSKKEFTKGDVEKRKQNYYNKLLFAICVSSPLIANFGFSNLVGVLYPVFGILGLVQIVEIFLQPIEKNNKN